MSLRTTVIPYEQQLSRDPIWALKEGSMHFEGQGAVQQTLLRITRRLTELNSPYAVAGGMALFRHGFRRFTEDVDLLVTPEGLQRVHDELEGLGYVRPFKDSKRLRDADSGVQIDFLVTGQFPGDGKPKPVAFPNPAETSVELEGIRYLALPQLVELKLASGMTGDVSRMKDLTDVVELIRLTGLPRDFADRLNPYVRDRFLDLWDRLQASPPIES
jgi:hypothetical protein